MKRTLIKDLPIHILEEVSVSGYVERQKKMKGFSFITLRDRSGVAQIIVSSKTLPESMSSEYCARFIGRVINNEQSQYGGIEIQASSSEVLSRGMRGSNIPLRDDGKISLEKLLDRRPSTLRFPSQREAIKLQSEILRIARTRLEEQDFIEVQTPKIIVEGGAGGSDSFHIDYFDEDAWLAQSPQLYHQMLMGAHERIFEVGPVFRAQNYATQRHVNEVTSLDVSMAFPESLDELRCMATTLVSQMIDARKEVPERSVVTVNYLDAMKVINGTGAQRMSGPEKLDLYKKLAPRGDELLVLQRTPASTTNFTVLTGENGLSENFKIIYCGQEVCSGSMRISSFEEIKYSMKDYGINSNEFGSFLEAYKCGLPPHGGFSIGINRLTANIIGVENIKEVIAFPRDPRRLRP